ncbi:MAG TPA: type II toxin-antitoxin system VapC family toxin [Pseudonocardiaceae bacterium]|nr:type II toxin-antitoxin system VapC family toxin [Pseudonocardiaceae bacterium]
MLVYLDSSVLGRAYLPDEDGHELADGLLTGFEHLLVTSTWTAVEVTSALCRAARGHRIANPDELLAVLAADLGEDGPVTVLRAAPEQVEHRSTRLVREHPLRSLDALHLAVAEIAAVPLLEPGEQLGFASRDEAQRSAAVALGFVDIWPPAR